MVGILQKVNDVVMIVEPHEVVSTGCLWPKLLLPIDVEGLIIGLPERAIPGSHAVAEHCP